MAHDIRALRAQRIEHVAQPIRDRLDARQGLPTAAPMPGKIERNSIHSVPCEIARLQGEDLMVVRGAMDEQERRTIGRERARARVRVYRVAADIEAHQALLAA